MIHGGVWVALHFLVILSEQIAASSTLVVGLFYFPFYLVTLPPRPNIILKNLYAFILYASLFFLCSLIIASTDAYRYYPFPFPPVYINPLLVHLKTNFYSLVLPGPRSENSGISLRSVFSWVVERGMGDSDILIMTLL
jgi:hypothetical protein